MKFYSPLGKELTLQDFINYYSDAYYTGKANGEVVKNLHKNTYSFLTFILCAELCYQ